MCNRAVPVALQSFVHKETLNKRFCVKKIDATTIHCIKFLKLMATDKLKRNCNCRFAFGSTMLQPMWQLGTSTKLKLSARYTTTCTVIHPLSG